MQDGDYRKQCAYLPASTAFLGCNWGISISNIEELIYSRDAKGKKWKGKESKGEDVIRYEKKGKERKAEKRRQKIVRKVRLRQNH
jgi:hypothetical protein